MPDNEHTFDAIVIGSGMSGGWAAKELGDKGIKTLVLERGRDVKHNVDYPTTNMYPYEFAHLGEIPLADQKANPIINRCYAFKEDAAHFFVKDTEHPYIQEKPFDWIRGYQVGGKSLMWARATQRWSDFDFEGPARDGYAVDWPIRYNDLAPWYSYVEKFAGISGNRDGLKQLPDGEFLPPFPLNAVEDYFKLHVDKHYANRHVINERVAHITQPQQIHLDQGRAKCQNRLLCQRGCPFGGYFSSNSSTIPWALKSGHVTLRPFSVVHSIIYDEMKGKATGVRVIDSETKKATEYFAKVIFVNAGAINTNLVLLNSTSKRFPDGLGNDNGLMGKYVAFHNYSARISAQYEGLKQYKEVGRTVGGGYMPRFRNLFKQETDFLRGYACGFSGYRSRIKDTSGTGAHLKENLLKPDELGLWGVGSHMMGETIPKESNWVKLDETQKDQWGIPLLKISVDYDDNDEKMKKDYFDQLSEMFTSAGFINIKTHNSTQAPGLDIHEMGGVRMGKDSKTSLLNKWNQMHSCKNVFVTDGACMTSTSTQNPSLTFMAFTVRAVDYAVKELKKGSLMILLCLFFSFAVNAQKDGFISPLRARGYTVFPTPQQIKLGNGDVAVDGSWALEQKPGTGTFSAKTFTQRAREYHGISFRSKSTKNIVLEISKDIRTGSTDTSLNAQAYSLSITPGKILVKGQTQNGLFYGVQSLLQLMKMNETGKILLPECEIVDWPNLQLRFSHWDTKHHQDRIETLKRYLDQAAMFKINAIAFEIYDKYEFPSHPVLGSPGAFTKAEMQDLTRYAKERFIELIPDVQAPAHMAYVLKHPEFAHLRADGNNYQACICDDESMNLIFDMYKDMVDATPGVNYFLVSTDEVYYAGLCDKCKLPYNEENRSLVWTQFVVKAHEWMAKHGRRVIAWIEYPLLKEHIAKLPAGMIDGAVGSASFSTKDWVEREKKAGISQIAYISMQGGEPLFPNYFPAKSGRSTSGGRLKHASEAISLVLKNDPNLVGTFAAAWGDAGLHNETFWLGWATVAQYGWTTNRPTIEQSTVDFMDVFYGSSSPELIEIYQLLDEGSRVCADSWDKIVSKEIKQSYGNSYGKGIGGIQYDRLLETPRIPTADNINTSPDFRNKYSQKIDNAEKMSAENDKLINLILHNITKVKRNKYNLEVMLSLAYLQRFVIHVLTDIAAIEDKIIEGSKANDNPRRVVSRWLEASRLAGKLLQEYEETYPSLTAVWEKSQYKRNRSVNGKNFLNVIPDVNSYGDVSRRTGLDYMFAPFERIGLKKWKADFDALIDVYATKNGIGEKTIEDDE